MRTGINLRGANVLAYREKKVTQKKKEKQRNHTNH